VRLWGSSLDITAHRQAQAALAESEAALKAFYESSPAYMGIVELSEDDILHVYDNPATCRIFDVPAGSTQGRWASEMGAAPDVTALWMARYRESAATGKPVTFDYLHRLRGEAARWLSTTVAPIPAGASARPRFCYVSLDTTERHEFELQLANAKEKAEHASRAKDEFLARLSHELRNPLNPVLLTASAEMEDPQRSQEEKDLWRLVYRNISLQARLIDDLLDLTRITRGRLTFNRSIIDTHQVLQDALATVRSDAEAKGHAISVSLDARYVRLYADPARLQQVFWNVLKNAVKFTPKGGAISVKTENPDSHGCLQIVIRDTGLGLTEEELDRIFEPFSQGDHARGKTSHAYGGLGLGLAISREIVQSHHGKIWAASNGRDQGSTFYIELPLAPSAAS
jgi:signal transduction histidine kinase